VKRRVMKILVLTGSFLMVPQYFQAEGTVEPNGKQPNLIGNIISEQSELVKTSLKETTDVVEVVANEATAGTSELTEKVVESVETTIVNTSEMVKKTSKSLTEPTINDTASTIVKETNNVVNETIESTKSIVNKTSESTKESICEIKKETKDVTKTLSKSIESVDKTIKKPVEQTLEKPVKQVDITPTQKSPNLVVEPDTKKTIVIPSLPEMDDNPVQREEVNTEKEEEPEKERETEIEIVPEDSTVAMATPIENKPLSKIKIQKLKSLSESLPHTERVYISTDQAVEKTKKEENLTGSEKLIPVSQNQKQEAQIFLAEPLENALTPSNPISSSYSSTSSAGISDGVQGVLLLLQYQSDQVNEWWHHGNKFALKQWIYDPLGKPPKFAPFLID